MKKHKKLQPYERDQIAIMRAKKRSIRSIARELNRSPSTISNEIQRSKDIIESEYIAIHAQYLSEERMKNSHKRKPLKNENLYVYVLAKIRCGWSPEQISGRLKKKYPDDKSMQIHWETIYRYIYASENQKLRLWEYLPRKRKKRRKKNGRKVQKCRIVGRVSIHKRAKKIDERKEFGHWEGDTVEGKGHKNGVHTEVERMSRLYRVRKVSRINGDETLRAQDEIFRSFPEGARRSVTLDNGKENTRHFKLREKLNMKTYFCDPYSSWQKGSNEYHNGLLRRYFPKGTDFSEIEQEEIDDIIEEINNRPRKVLNFETPNEVFTRLLSKCSD